MYPIDGGVMEWWDRGARLPNGLNGFAGGRDFRYPFVCDTERPPSRTQLVPCAQEFSSSSSRGVHTAAWWNRPISQRFVADSNGREASLTMAHAGSGSARASVLHTKERYESSPLLRCSGHSGASPHQSHHSITPLLRPAWTSRSSSLPLPCGFHHPSRQVL